MQRKFVCNDDSFLLGKHVLVVDDTRSNWKLCCKLLEKASATTEVAEDGIQAVAAVKANPDAYDLIIMDKRMPNMNGIEAIEVIKKDLKNTTPIILCTADVTPAVRREGEIAGAKEFLPKPLKKSDFYDAVVRVLTE